MPYIELGPALSIEKNNCGTKLQSGFSSKSDVFISSLLLALICYFMFLDQIILIAQPLISLLFKL